MNEAERISFFDKKSKEIEALKERDPELCRREIIEFEQECGMKGLYLPLPFLVDYLISLYFSERQLTADGEYTLLSQEQRSALYLSFLEGVRFANKQVWMSHEWPDGWNEYVRPKLVNLIADIGEFRPEQAEELRPSLGQITEEEQQRLGNSYHSERPEAVMQLLLRARTIVPLSDEEADVLQAIQPVAELWRRFIRGESAGEGALPKCNTIALDQSIQFMHSMMDRNPLCSLCSVALDKLIGFCCLLRAQFNLSMGESENCVQDCDTYLTAFSDWPNAGLQIFECYAQLGHDDRVRELFSAIDPADLDDDERDDYRRLGEYLTKDHAVINNQGNRNSWLHILYFVLATVAIMFTMSLLMGH